MVQLLTLQPSPVTPQELAVAYAEQGWPCFPCRHAAEDVVDPQTGELEERGPKTPLLSNGVKGAIKPPATVRRAWDRHPNAMVGLPTGEKTGFFVLDIDAKPGSANGFDWLSKMEATHGPLPETARVTTPNGGIHIYFKHNEGVRNRGALGAGVDIRGEGGYVIGAGSAMGDGRRYDWANDVRDIAEAPAWLLDLVKPKAVPGDASRYLPTPPGTNNAYVDAAIDRELSDLAGTPMGSRNSSLNDAAFNLGQWVGGGHVSESDARAWLQDVARGWGRDWSRCCKTIESGLKAGILSPRHPPEPDLMPDNTQPLDPAILERFVQNSLRKKAAVAERKSEPVAANDNKPAAAGPLIISSADLVRGFVPPDYHIDGVAQKGFVYSMTASTGTGKTAVLLLITQLTAEGGELSGREVSKGRVVYFAGENPDDVTMRWIGMSHEIGFDMDDINVYFIKDRFNVAEALAAIRKQVEDLGGADLIVVDTSAAYFFGTDENSNTELGKHARDLRALTTLPGRPCVMVACHPTKNVSADNLLPRGGGAFIAEVDGNLTLAKSDGLVKMHWQGKHRGPDFDPLSIELKTITAPALVDSKGRPIPTVMAQALSTSEARAMATNARRDEDDALLLIDRDAKMSLAGIAEASGWLRKDGAWDKDRARRATSKLKDQKLATYEARKWKVTAAGAEAAIDIRADRHRDAQTAQFASRMAAKSRVPWRDSRGHDDDDE